MCDAHPGYATTRWAQAAGLPVEAVLHHHAHASALVTEHGIGETAIGVCLGRRRPRRGWDALGRRDVRRPRRRLASASPACGRSGCPAATRRAARPGAVLRRCAGKRAWRCRSSRRTRSCGRPGSKGVNAPQTSAVGRVFDAAAALVLGRPGDELRGPGADVAGGDRRGLGRVSLAADRARRFRPRADRLGAAAAAPARTPGASRRPRGGAAPGAGRCDREGLRDGSGPAPAPRSSGLTGGVFQNRRLSELALRGARAARIPRAAGGTRALQRWRPQLRPGRRFSRSKRLDCRDALVRTSLPDDPAARVLRGHAFCRGRRVRRDARCRRPGPANCTCTSRSARCCVRSARSTGCVT